MTSHGKRFPEFQGESMIETDGEEPGPAVWQRNSLVGLEMHFPLGSSKTILERPRKTIRNFANICYIKSSQPGTSKHLIVERNALSQKQVSQFQSLIIPENIRSRGLTLVFWFTWVSLALLRLDPSLWQETRFIMEFHSVLHFLLEMRFSVYY